MKIRIHIRAAAFAAVLAAAFCARAASVSSGEAMSAVSAWIAANGETIGAPGEPVSAVPAYDDDGATVLYWIVAMSGGGAVIASPDTDLDLVVAVVENYGGSFPAGHPLPSILKKDMKNRLSVIAAKKQAQQGGGMRSFAAAPVQASLPARVQEAVDAANRQWAKYGVGSPALGTKAASLDGDDTSPYVRRIVDGFESGGRFTHWDQGNVGGWYCYNLYTPEHAVCGCVATAGAAILQFFNCTNSPGVITGDTSWNGKPVSAEYKTTKPGAMDWSILPVAYGGKNTSSGVLDDAGRELLGRAAFNMGVLVSMAWDVGGPGTESAAFTTLLVDAFKAFGFQTARAVSFDGAEDADPNQYFKTIYAQNWCGAPVVLSISNDSGGHAVVGCGYARDPDGDEFCRVFMGWAGVSDAWYRFPKIKDFNVVDSAITMIGYEDYAVVPVYGEANIPGAELTLPGYITNGVAVTTLVNENGYFGVRVPASITDLHVVFEPRNKSVDIDPFDAGVLADETADRATLDTATPDETKFSIMDTTVKYTVNSADAVAECDGKALLMVSGLPGEARTKALMEHLSWLDETTDMSNKYVLVFNSINSTDPTRSDGNPSIGVFDPYEFDPELRWQESNGRLAYDNFEGTNDTVTGEIEYVFSATNTAYLTNNVQTQIESGYVTYLQQNSGITLEITGVDAHVDLSIANVDPNAEFGDGDSTVPAYGIYENCYTNGEIVAFYAPGEFTNEAAGVIYSCVGWSTNDVYRYEDTFFGSRWVRYPFNDGTNAEIQVFAGNNVKFTWVWDVTGYRVTSTNNLSYQANGGVEAVSPALAWVKSGDRITLSAVPSIGAYGFDQWKVESEKGVDLYETGDADALVWPNGTAVSFTVNEPVNVTAKYRSGSTQADPETYTVNLDAYPDEVLDAIPSKFQSGFSIGANTVTDAVVRVLSPEDYIVTDATGGVWTCTNIVASGAVEYGGDGYWVLEYSPADFVTYWRLGEEEPPPAEPEPIAFTSVVQANPGAWTITLTNGVKGCWYWLYVTDDLAAIAGDPSGWTAGLATTLEPNPQQAEEDGAVTFHAAQEGAPLFWKAKATSTEGGDE